ncbi:MAG: helix-hairpin-helix domain-containing protein [Roseburia sp.]
MLIKFVRIGPKVLILSVMSTDDLRFAVLSDDAKAIAKAPGVGNKTAQRLIMKLKDKLGLEDALRNDFKPYTKLFLKVQLGLRRSLMSGGTGFTGLFFHRGFEGSS